jgi:hypothetical protein
MGRTITYAPTPKGLKVAQELVDQIAQFERSRCLAVVQDEVNRSIAVGEASAYRMRLARVKARILAGG